ncbi:hypothetical protein STANM309S_03792 [Streptomyces tanashiensis]
MLARGTGNRSLYALRKVYLLQGALVWLVSLPVQVAPLLPEPLDAPAAVGLALWAAGVFLEATGRPSTRPVQGRPRAQGTHHGPGTVELDQPDRPLRADAQDTPAAAARRYRLPVGADQ